MKKLTKLSVADSVYVAGMALACFVSYEASTRLLAGRVDTGDQFLGGMWAVVATVFVFRDSRSESVSAGFDRLLATVVSFVLCLVYLSVFPFSPLALAVLLGMGTAVMIVLDRRDDIVTTGITTSVVMVVAALSPHHPWHQPLLRLFDTIVGIVVGVAFDQMRCSLSRRLQRER